MALTTKDGNLESFGAKSAWFKEKFVVEFSSGDFGEDAVYVLQTSSEKDMNIEVYCDGNQLDCEIVEVDFDPTSFVFGSFEE